MTEKIPKSPAELTPKLQKVRNDLDRVLADFDLSQAEYDALMDDLKKRRRRIEGAGDSLLDDIADE